MVAGLDATIVFAAWRKYKAGATYKGGIGFCPNLAPCDNTDEALVINPRPGKTSPLWTRRSPACRGHSGAGCWSALTGPG